MNLKGMQAAWLAAALCCAPAAMGQRNAASAATAAPAAVGVLAKEAVAPLVPQSVFFAGQVAPTQVRNAGAVRTVVGNLIIATLVDTSGYSSSVQEKYQAYLINEAHLVIDGNGLPPGAYGCGFIANDRFIVMDVAGNTLFTAHSTRDQEMRRPTPLQMVAEPGGDGYRLYAGRSYVTLRVVKQ